jgi:hypothetical protein
LAHIFLASEHLSAAALLGVGTLAAGLTIASYTIVDGLGVRRAASY